MTLADLPVIFGLQITEVVGLLMSLWSLAGMLRAVRVHFAEARWTP